MQHVNELFVGVADGDTLTVLDEQKTQHKIRLMGIDAQEEYLAQRDRRGLWADKEPVAPWDFRRAKRQR